jgi:hypothetical protein
VFAPTLLFGFSEPITLHFRVFAKVMFFAGDREKNGKGDRGKPGAE